jgi:hypothetical protein
MCNVRAFHHREGPCSFHDLEECLGDPRLCTETPAVAANLRLMILIGLMLVDISGTLSDVQHVLQIAQKHMSGHSIGR